MKISKVLLIDAGHYDAAGRIVKANRLIDRLTSSYVVELNTLLIAAYTPKNILVEKVDDYIEQIPWDTDADVIGISAQIMQLKRANDIADKFKERGKIVVMGGFLPSMHPEAVMDHVDSICIGEGDTIWPQMLRDIEQGQLKKIYKAKQLSTLQGLPVPRYDLVKKDRLTFYPIQATRGCPYTCDYCSIVQFFNYTYRYRPIPEIIRDIQAVGSKNIYFVDDNLMENRKFAKELFSAMSPLGVTWGTQCTVNIAKDPELLALAYHAGCRYVAVGAESISQKNLAHVSKNFNQVDQYVGAFKSIQDAGIAVHALIIFGLPEDTVDTFDLTVKYLEQCNVAIGEFFLLMPYPKTPAGSRMSEAGLVSDTDLSHYRETYVVFKHPSLTSEQIIDGYWRAHKKFYSFRSMIKRIFRATYRHKWLHMMNNLYYWFKIKRGIVPVYFGRGN